MLHRATWGTVITAGFLTVGLPSTGEAQPTDQPSTPSATALQEIVVIARRREEKLQSVPVAVTAFNQADIDEHEIQDGSDLMRLVPSLFANSATGNGLGFSIRGQGGGFGGSPGVVSYLDEVPIGAGTGIGFYYDLENVQVLKGPQGTLFGRNTTGGAVLFQPKHPTSDFEGYYQQTVGNYDWLEEQGAINVPVIGDKVLIRFAFDRKTRDGYTKDIGPNFPGRDYDNVDYWAERLAITLRPTDNLEIYTMVDSYYSDTHGPGTQLSVLNPNFPIGGPTFPLKRVYPGLVSYFTNIQALGPRYTAFSTDNAFLNWNYGITNILRWDITDDLTFKNISSDNVSKNYTRWDVDGSPFALLDNIFGNGNWYNTPTAVYTEEPQLQGKSFDEKLTWVTGLFYEYDHPTGYSVNVVNEFLGLLPSDPLFNPSQAQTKYKAAYAQATYDLSGISSILAGLSVTAGYRYSWIHVSSWADQYFPNGKCAQRTGFRIPNCTLAGSGDFAHGTYTFGVNYQITPDTLVYVTDATGFKQGGFNSLGTTGQTEFAPENVKNVEIGLKTDWDLLGVKARTDIAAFHSSYDNIQRSIAVYTPQATIATETENAAQATIEGVEFEGTFILTPAIELQIAYSWNNSLYNRYFSPVNGDLRGYPFPDTPQNKFSVSPTYHLPINAAWGDLSITPTWTYESHVVWTLDNAPLSKIGSYSLYDVRIDWKDILGWPLDAAFFMTNMTNTVYRLGGDDTYPGTGTATALYGQPRMFGFQLRYRFSGASEETHEAATTQTFTPPPVQAPVPAAKSYLVFFDFDRSELTPQARRIVDEAAQNAQAGRVTRIEVTGHTDTVGSDAYNIRLSRRRADAVASALEARGISASEIAIFAKGKRDLLVPTGDGVREPQNRRVEIVYSSETGPTS